MCLSTYVDRHFSLSRSIAFTDFLDYDSSFHLQGGATSVHQRANETPVSVRLPRTRADGAKTRGRVTRASRGLLKRHARRDRDVGFKMEGIGEGFTSYGETV